MVITGLKWQEQSKHFLSSTHLLCSSEAQNAVLRGVDVQLFNGESECFPASVYGLQGSVMRLKATFYESASCYSRSRSLSLYRSCVMCHALPEATFSPP
jgi:hypothetical protein